MKTRFGESLGVTVLPHWHGRAMMSGRFPSSFAVPLMPSADKKTRIKKLLSLVLAESDVTEQLFTQSRGSAAERELLTDLVRVSFCVSRVPGYMYCLLNRALPDWWLPLIENKISLAEFERGLRQHLQADTCQWSPEP